MKNRLNKKDKDIKNNKNREYAMNKSLKGI